MRHPVTAEIVTATEGSSLAEYYTSLFSEYEIISADMVMRLVDRWFVFTELLVELRDRDRGKLVARLADVCVVGNDNQILVHLGTSAGPAEPAG
jgi:hypothetical protein